MSRRIGGRAAGPRGLVEKVFGAKPVALCRAGTGRVRRALAEHPRVGLAVKAAFAASVAWALVRLVPGPAADYPYYAPLGAVIATSSTLVGSAREAGQSVAAITLGAVIALGVDALAGPNLVTIAVVIAIGVLLAGWHRLGTASTWVPTSALFVLIIGHGNPLPYVAGYAGLTLMGALVGLAVTAAFPPLPLTPASAQTRHLRDMLADQLDELVDGLLQQHPPTREEWQHRRYAVEPVLAQMRAAVGQADEARRGNRIARRYRDDADRQYRQARALERLAFLVEDVSQLITEAETAEKDRVALGPALRPAAARALDRLARVLRSVDGAAAGTEVGREAFAALDALTAELRRTRAATADDLFVAGSIAENVRRSLAAVVPDEEAPDDAATGAPE